jgi:hypothetical protein
MFPDGRMGGTAMSNREEKIAFYKTRIDAHYRNIDLHEMRISELQTGVGVDEQASEIAATHQLMDVERREIKKLEALIKQLEEGA